MHFLTSMCQGEDVAQSQEHSLRALHEMQSDRHDPLLQAEVSLPVAVYSGPSSSQKINPYSGLYSDAPSDVEQQGLGILQADSEAMAGDGQSDAPSGGSESQSVADEVASNGVGSEEFVDDGF